MKEKIFAFDFDGTLCVGNNFPKIGKPRMWLINMAKTLQQRGHKIILWTCRENSGGNLFEDRRYLDEAVDWCKQYGLIFDAVNSNINEEKYPGVVFCRKVFADWYIDDKAGNIDDDNEAIFGCIDLPNALCKPDVIIQNVSGV